MHYIVKSENVRNWESFPVSKEVDFTHIVWSGSSLVAFAKPRDIASNEEYKNIPYLSHDGVTWKPYQNQVLQGLKNVIWTGRDLFSCWGK